MDPSNYITHNLLGPPFKATGQLMRPIAGSRCWWICSTTGQGPRRNS
jgi:hypothetical protein